jgi:hypothetical protein
MDIQIIDNFLNENESQFITDFFDNHVKWAYGHNSRHGQSIKWFKSLLDNYPFFTEYLLTKINKTTKSDWELKTVYANGQTILLDGGWHTDTQNDDADYMTALLYISEITPQNIDIVNGHTEFKINDEIKSIEPLKNRLIIFNSKLLHRGRAPSIPEMFRISVAWKLKKKI